jgi:hypothetical protein
MRVMPFPRFLVVAASLAAAAVVACDEGSVPDPAPGAAPATEPDPGGICNQGPRPTDGGGELWQWRIRWVPEAGKTLADVCGGHGASAVVEVKIDVLDRGAIAQPLVFSAPCTQGELLLDLPSRTVFHGYRRLRDPDTERTTGWSVMTNDVHCPRDVFFVASTR